MKRGVFTATLLLALCGCSGDFTEDPSLVKRLRILSIAAEPPGLAPGNSTTLSALVADPRGGGRAIDHLWAICVPLFGLPPDTPVNESLCANPASWFVLGTGATISYTVPAGFLDGLDAAQRATGLDVPIVLEVTAGGDRHDAVKRVHVAEGAPFDRNPSVVALRIDGVDPGAGGTASVAWGSTVSISADVTDPDGGSGVVEIYVTAGHLESPQTSPGANDFWTLSGTPPAEAWVYAVTRDGAGGNGWTSRRVAVP